MRKAAVPSPLRWYTLARVAILIWILTMIVATIQFLPVRYQNLASLDYDSGGGNLFGLWTIDQLRAMVIELGLRPEMLAATTLAMSLAGLLCFWMVGGLLWLKSGTWMGLLTAYLLFATGPGFCQLIPVEPPPESWLNAVYNWGALLIWPTFYLTLYIFPNGRFVPRFSRYFAPLPYLLFFFGDSVTQLSQLFTYAGGAALVIYMAGGPVSQIYRYRKVSTPEERQQTKWVVAAFVALVLAIVIPVIVTFLVPGLNAGTPARFWFDYINGIAGYLITAMIPLAIGISIFRYRLWDIDLIIRKTLVYGLLTAVLALVYFGMVIILQTVFGSLTGEQSPVVIVISTLVIAALFSTLRGRVQRVIDRRFFRQKYDAEQVLAQFAQSARDEVELEALTAEMVRTVDETMRPEWVQVWLQSKPVARRQDATQETQS